MHTTTIRGAVFRGPRLPLVPEELRLDPPGPGEVRVRRVASGVCHSDLHVVDGEWTRPADVVLGHEGAGIGLAPATGQLIRAGITDTPPPVDPLPFRVARPSLIAAASRAAHG